MALLDEIQEKVRGDQFEFSKHAVDQSIVRRISLQELREAISSGEVIEDYPNDRYGPSCLIYGETLDSRPLHIQCSYPSRPLVKIITLYEPNPNRWVNFRERQ